MTRAMPTILIGVQDGHTLLLYASINGCFFMEATELTKTIYGFQIWKSITLIKSRLHLGTLKSQFNCTRVIIALQWSASSCLLFLRPIMYLSYWFALLLSFKENVTIAASLSLFLRGATKPWRGHSSESVALRSMRFVHLMWEEFRFQWIHAIYTSHTDWAETSFSPISPRIHAAKSTREISNPSIHIIFRVRTAEVCLFYISSTLLMLLDRREYWCRCLLCDI